MTWTKAEYSKKEVMRAGETLINAKSEVADREHAMNVLSNWRAAHAYPMHALLILLRKKSREINKNAVVVQRLKRTPSILYKLIRFPNMKLHRMQDISGCRAILNNVKDVEKLLNLIKESRTRNTLHKINNYIVEPKDTGYRGIHLIYKYGGEKIEYRDYFIELQIRSKIQHAWATAVEIVDTFTKQALKANLGNRDWLDFFRYVSAEFAKIEKRPVGEDVQNIDTRTELTRLTKKLNVIYKLNAFAISTNHITQAGNNKTDYFLLELTNDAIHVSQYKTSDLELATRDYLKKETETQKNKTSDVVLVAATSMHALRSAYPNYFADSKEFLKYISQIVNGVQN